MKQPTQEMVKLKKWTKFSGFLAKTRRPPKMAQSIDHRIKMGPYYSYELGILIPDHFNTRFQFVLYSNIVPILKFRLLHFLSKKSRFILRMNYTYQPR
jgi:hypothetical protein